MRLAFVGHRPKDRRLASGWERMVLVYTGNPVLNWLLLGICREEVAIAS
jgi:hypothetical protein